MLLTAEFKKIVFFARKKKIYFTELLYFVLLFIINFFSAHKFSSIITKPNSDDHFEHNTKKPIIKLSPPLQTSDNRFEHLTHLYGDKKQKRKSTRERHTIHSNFTSFITKSIISQRPAAVSKGAGKPER